METMERRGEASYEVEPAMVCIEGFLKFTRQKLVDSGLESFSKEELLAYKSEYLDSIYGPDTLIAVDSQPVSAPLENIDSNGDKGEAEFEVLPMRTADELITPVEPAKKKARPRRRHGALKYGSAVAFATLVSIPISNAFIDSNENSNKAAGQEPVPTLGIELENLTPEATATEEVSAPIDSASETTAETTTTTIEPVQSVEATAPPAPARAITMLESVANGERILEEIPGTQVGTLSIEGICLDDIQISVANAVELADIPAEFGDAEEARSTVNPMYKVEADETPQQVCELPGVSGHDPRWVRQTAGSQRIKNVFSSPAEILPQASIHAYSTLPGNNGVTYIEGHRTTYSAPFTNLDALTPGATASFSDGFNVYNYTFIGFEQVNPYINISEILGKTVDGKNTLIVSTCDEGDDVRLLAIFTLAS